MSFANLGWPLTLLGLAALAGGLYLLQRLRVRHRRVPVATTLFWREAVEESRARVLTRRFRHPWAYALILLIASLIWLALAGPERRAGSEARTVVLLDGSARMARGDLFARAKAAALAAAGELPRDAREVVLCGAYPRRVLAPGEDILLLEKRLEPLGPDACPSTLSAVLRRMARDELSGTAFRVVTDATTWRAPDDIPADREVARVALEAKPTTNRGIVALGMSEAASGRFDAVDVFIEVRRAPDAEPASPLGIALDDREVGASPAPVPAPEIGGARYWMRDVPARGQTLTVRLPGKDDLALDDEASLVLPRRRVLRVAIDDALADVVGPIVDADPALVRDERGLEPDVLVVRTELGPGGDVPTLAFVPESDDAPMLHVTHPEIEALSEAFLDEVAASLGLHEIDAVALATAAGRVVEVQGDPGPVRALAFWESLATDRYDLVHTRTFPALLSRALRWLGGIEPLAPYVAAGEPLDDGPTALTDADGRAHRAISVAATPPVAGRYEAVHAMLAAPALTTLLEGDADDASVHEAGGLGGSAATWLLLAAFLLLCFEWVLFRTERIP